MMISADLSTKYDKFYVSQGFCGYVCFLESWPDGTFLIVDVRFRHGGRRYVCRYLSMMISADLSTKY